MNRSNSDILGRRTSIHNYIREAGRISITDLGKSFPDDSVWTIRRDVKILSDTSKDIRFVKEGNTMYAIYIPEEDINVESTLRNQEHYKDPTPHAALKEKTRGNFSKTVSEGDIWHLSNDKVLYVLYAGGNYTVGLQIVDKLAPGEEGYDSPGVSGQSFHISFDRTCTVTDEKMFSKRICHINVVRRDDIREAYGRRLGYSVEPPIKSAEPVVEQTDYRNIEMKLLLQKIDIYERVMKAQNLL